MLTSSFIITYYDKTHKGFWNFFTGPTVTKNCDPKSLRDVDSEMCQLMSSYSSRCTVIFEFF